MKYQYSKKYFGKYGSTHNNMEGGNLQIPAGLSILLIRGNTHFNYVPLGGKFISCYAIKN